MFSLRRVAWVMVSLNSNRIVTKTEVGIREYHMAVPGLIMLLVGKNMEEFRTLD